MRAAVAGHASVCSQLLRAGSAADAQDSDGQTALHKAAAQQHAAAVAVLLQACPEAARLKDRRGRLPIEPPTGAEQ